MTNSESVLLGQMITDSKQTILHAIRDQSNASRRDIHFLTKRVMAMERATRDAGQNTITVTRLEKWIVRGATVGLPTATFFLTGSWEKAVQVFFQLAK